MKMKQLVVGLSVMALLVGGSLSAYAVNEEKRAEEMAATLTHAAISINEPATVQVAEGAVDTSLDASIAICTMATAVEPAGQTLESTEANAVLPNVREASLNQKAIAQEKK